ncbi:MAG: twin-arginine translocation signal domain-containing protein [Gemmataceae bacterium]|nr:twin-arginine translocation signal domain-containing protein [Gemmataceae bacterium]
MTASNEGLDRRDFLKAAAGGGFALGSLLSLGLDLRAAQAEVRRLRIQGVKEVPSVCPYCAVGCGQLVHVREGRIINIEGNPSSPINQGTLCPKGAATYQLAVNPNRLTHVLYRAPRGTRWERRTLDWAMDRIARLAKQTRDESFQRDWQTRDSGGNPVSKRVNHTLRIASLGGATMDNEWNYLQAKLMRALGVVFIENQARI